MPKSTKSTATATRTVTTVTKRVSRTVSRKPASGERIREVFESGILNGLDNANTRLIAIYLLATGQTLDNVSDYAVGAAVGIWPHRARGNLKRLRDSKTLVEILG